jgi:DNA-binding GntR family transcriptional regulator
MRLARLVAQLLDEMERMLIYDPVYTDPTPTPFEHEQILVALKASDTEAAQEAVRYHVQTVKSRILERFQ